MKKFCFIVCCVFMFLLGACSVSVASAEQTWPLKIWAQNENGAYQTLCVVDEDTGVNYAVDLCEEHFIMLADFIRLVKENTDVH